MTASGHIRRTTQIKRTLALVCAVLLASCWSEMESVQKFAPKEDDEFARRFIDLLRQGRIEEADPMLESAVAARAGASGLNKLHQVIDHGEPKAFALVGAHLGYFQPFGGSSPKRQTNLVYQLQFENAWIVATVTVESGSNGRHIISANFQPLADSLQVIHRFTLRNKSPVHYLFLAACFAVPLFIITTLVICARTRVRRRWLWIVFILFCFVQFKLNWTTGAWDVLPLSFNLLGAGWTRASSYAPVILNFALPLGAIVFLICRPRLRRASESLPPAPNGDELANRKN